MQVDTTDKDALIAQLQTQVAQLSGGLNEGEVDGFAECVGGSEIGTACEDYKALRPIRVRVEVMNRLFPPGSSVHGVESSTKYIHAVDDTDLVCPACGGPRSVLEGAPRRIPKAI